MQWTNPLAQHSGWNIPITHRRQKEMRAVKLALRLKDGDVVGIGSGSTSYLALLELAKRSTEEGLKFHAITSSIEIELVCTALHIPLSQLHNEQPDWSFDGADEVDMNDNLIKGRGGALLREKLLMKSSPEVYILIDSSKKVTHLGQNFPVPIEVIPSAVQLVETQLISLNEVTEVVLRKALSKDGPVITESGNLLLDVRFKKIPNDMERRLKCITGVIETGLFMGYPVHIIE